MCHRGCVCVFAHVCMGYRYRVSDHSSTPVCHPSLALLKASENFSFLEARAGNWSAVGVYTFGIDRSVQLTSTSRGSDGRLEFSFTSERSDAFSQEPRFHERHPSGSFVLIRFYVVTFTHT